MNKKTAVPPVRVTENEPASLEPLTRVVVRLLVAGLATSLCSGCFSAMVRPDRPDPSQMAALRNYLANAGSEGRPPSRSDLSKDPEEVHSRGTPMIDAAALTDNQLQPATHSLPPIPALPSTGSPAEHELKTVLNAFGEPVYHYGEVSEAAILARQRTDELEQTLQKERLEGNWFAAALGRDGEGSPTIRLRFLTSAGLDGFIRQEGAWIETWVYAPDHPDADPLLPGRLLPPPAIAALQGQRREAPTFSVLVSFDASSQALRRDRLEFGFQHAAAVLAEEHSYHRHRLLQETGREIMRSRNSTGSLSPNAQWDRLLSAIRSGDYEIVHLPQPPDREDGLFVAAEYQSTAQGNFTRPLRLYRRDEISKGVVDGVEFLLLQPAGEKQATFALAFPVQSENRAGWEEPSPLSAFQPVAAHAAVEMRVFDPYQSDERMWNILDFGEPEITLRRGLAGLGLLQGCLEKKAKSRALTKSKIDLFVEPVVAGLSIGAGLSGMDAPVGDGVRLLYNTIIAPAFLERAPRTTEYPALLRELAGSPAEMHSSHNRTPLAMYFSEEDIRLLRSRLSSIPPRVLDDMLRITDDHDLTALSKLSRSRSLDARYRLLVDVLSGTGNVTGTTDSGALEAIFNNSILALNGEFSIKNLLAWLSGNKNLTPLSGFSLADLAEGRGPSSAWWQFLDFSIDLRALLNAASLHRDRRRTDRELLRPFPHATRASDWSAYELRLFGYPLLLFPKRKLIEQDADAFETDFAYGVIGARIVERFRDRESFQAEIQDGRAFPLGFVSVTDGERKVRASHLPVYGHRLPSGEHAGKLALVLFGFDALRTHADLIGRDYDRFQLFEATLSLGGVIEQPLAHERRSRDSGVEWEPRIFAGDQAIQVRYDGLLNDLLEYDRAIRLDAWGLPSTAEELSARREIARRLRQAGVAVDQQPSPLREVDTRRNRFVYAQRAGQMRRWVAVTLVPSPEAMARSLRKAEVRRDIEASRKAVLQGEDGEAFGRTRDASSP